MRLPRFTILQMLLAASLVALVLGLATSAWRTNKLAQITHLEFSPTGRFLAAKFSGGSVQVWDISSPRPRLAANFPSQGFLNNFDVGPLRFVDDTTLVDLRSRWSNTTYETIVRSLDLKTGRVTEGQAIPFSAYVPSFAATRRSIALPNWSGGSIELYDLPTGKFRRTIPVKGSPWYLALSDDERYVAAIDQNIGQNSGLQLIDTATGQTLLVKSGGTMIAAMDIKGQCLAAARADFSTTTSSPAPTCSVDIIDLKKAGSTRSLEIGMTFVTWLRLSDDGSRLSVADYAGFEYYDVASGKRLTRIAFHGSDLDADLGFFPNFSFTMPGQNLALSPDGKTLASFSGGQITLRDLPSGKVRQKITGGWRSLQIAIFTLGFVGWAAAWGIVARRERLRRGLAEPAVYAAQLQPPPSRPANPPPASISQLWRSLLWFGLFVVLATGLLTLEGSWSIPEVIGYGLLMIVGIVAAVVVVATVYYWLAWLIMGPHYLRLVRLRQIAHDPGRLHTSGNLTAAFFGPSNIESHYAGRAATVLKQAGELFGRTIDFSKSTFIACLDRQGDLDAYMLRHVPIAAVVPNVWTTRLALVCEESALRKLIDPGDAFSAALALLLAIQHKRGHLPGWASTFLVHELTRNDRSPAGLRAAIRRLRVLAVRRPDWDPRRVFTRTANERATIWLAGDQPEAGRELQAEIDFLATLSEILLGPDAPEERRGRARAWLQGLRPKDDPLATFTRDVGLTLEELLAQWRAWRDCQTGLPYDPLPDSKAAAAGAMHAPILWNRSLPAAERGLAARQLGGSGYVALASLLLDELDDPRCDIRLDLIEALENIAGQPLGDNPAAWSAWYERLPAEVRAWPSVTYTRAAADAPLQAVVLDGEPQLEVPPSAPPGPVAPTPAVPAPSIPRSSAPPVGVPPTELKLCWGLMFLGGCAALVIPISLMFLWGPLYFPTIYFALVIGVLAVAKGAARETLGLKTVAKMQAASIIACDPINMLLGSMEFNLLNRPHVLDYLIRANGGRL